MSAYALTPLAKADIFDIWSYIAEDSQDAAGRVEQAIYDACAFLNASEFKAKCLALIDQVHQGGEPILIRKRGKIVARLTGESDPENRPWLNLRGKSHFVGDPYAPVVNEKDIEAWLKAACHPRTVEILPITQETAAEIARLPTTFHPDPADRIIVSTARARDIPLFTPDRRILDARLTKKWL